MTHELSSYPGASRLSYSPSVSGCRNSNADELVVDVRSGVLHVRSEDAGMIAEVLVECVAAPAAFDFHDFEREAA